MAYLCGFSAIGVIPESVVADLVESLGEDVLQISAHEFQAGEMTGACASPFAVLELEGDEIVLD